MFRIGMNTITRLWSVKAVQAVSYLSMAVRLSLVIDDVLNQRYYEAKDKGKKKDDIPDRFKEEKSYKGESGKDTAKRVLKNLENTI